MRVQLHPAPDITVPQRSSCLPLFQIVEGGKIRKTVLLDKLPNILTLQVKRFAFDHRRNTPVKVSGLDVITTMLRTSPELVVHMIRPCLAD